MKTERLYRRIDLDDLEETGESPVPVQFVGVYVLRWGRDKEPSVGFWEAEDAIYVEALREYLDETIKHWRKQRNMDAIKAEIYIDAYQSVRESVLGEILPK